MVTRRRASDRPGPTGIARRVRCPWLPVELIEVAGPVPGAVLYLLSSLSFHGIGTQVPAERDLPEGLYILARGMAWSPNCVDGIGRDANAAQRFASVRLACPVIRVRIAPRTSAGSLPQADTIRASSSPCGCSAVSRAARRSGGASARSLEVSLGSRLASPRARTETRVRFPPPPPLPAPAGAFQGRQEGHARHPAALRCTAKRARTPHRTPHANRRSPGHRCRSPVPGSRARPDWSTATSAGVPGRRPHRRARAACRDRRAARTALAATRRHLRAPCRRGRSAPRSG